MKRWPPWWNWPLELSSHLLRRMVDRRFTELDLRAMLEDALAVHPDAVRGRFVVFTRFDGRYWEIILEPDPAQLRLAVVTAYPIEELPYEA